MPDLIIVAAGGHGRETVDIVEAVNREIATWNLLGFVDDGDVDRTLVERRAPLLGPLTILESGSADYVLALGSPTIKAQLDERLRATASGTAATLVHPLASVGGDNQFGPGVLLAAGARVTTNVSLGRHVHLNVNSVVSHDCRIGDHTTISPGCLLNGNVSVGDRTFLGTGTIAIPGVSIGSDVTVGAGSVVVRDIADGAIVKGVPARP